MPSITLHPEHGVNPSMGVCFWCQKDNGTILLLGRNKGKEAPRRMVSDLEPCDDCKAKMALGITLMEARKENGKPVPTGRWCVLKEEAAQRIFNGEAAEQMMRTRKAYVPREVVDHLGLFKGEIG